MTSDDLGSRMKNQYEFRSRALLPRRTYTIIRIDGKNFHSYTRDLERPFDYQLIEDMEFTAKYLCEQIQGARFAYTQSDEISILLTDFETNQTDAWYDGNVQKMVSVSASLATAKFNELRPGKLACFDSRIFVIPDPIEVRNYFVWRQQDAVRNSISMAAQAKFSHKQLHDVSSNQMQEMLWSEHGINWNDYPIKARRGTSILHCSTSDDIEYLDKRTGEKHVAENVHRMHWQIEEASKFTATIDMWRSSSGYYKKLIDLRSI